MVGQTVHSLGKEKTRSVFAALCDVIGSEQVWRGTTTGVSGTGTRAFDTVVSPVRDAEGNATHFVVVARDMTKELELEAQVRQAQKLEAIGQLAGGVAHDFNNLLLVIGGNVELMRSEPFGDDELAESLDEIAQATEKATALVRQLLIFSRREVTQFKEVDLNELVRRLSKMATRLIGEHIEFSIQLDAELETIHADPGQVEQVLMNLWVNARDAMPDGGRLRVQTEKVRTGCPDGLVGDHALLLVEIPVVACHPTSWTMCSTPSSPQKRLVKARVLGCRRYTESSGATEDW